MAFNLVAIMELLNGEGEVVEHFQLRVDRVVHTIGRNPVVFSIPGVGAQDATHPGMPQVFALDFGMLTENMILSGVLPDNEPAGGSPAPTVPETDPYFPNHRELAAIARTWWRYSFESDSFAMTNYNRLKLEEGPGPGQSRYGVIIQNLQSTRVGGETKWDYKLTLAVVDFPGRV